MDRNEPNRSNSIGFRSVHLVQFHWIGWFSEELAQFSSGQSKIESIHQCPLVDKAYQCYSYVPACFIFVMKLEKTWPIKAQKLLHLTNSQLPKSVQQFTSISTTTKAKSKEVAEMVVPDLHAVAVQKASIIETTVPALEIWSEMGPPDLASVSRHSISFQQCRSRYDGVIMTNNNR